MLMLIVLLLLHFMECVHKILKLFDVDEYFFIFKEDGNVTRILCSGINLIQEGRG